MNNVFLDLVAFLNNLLYICFSSLDEHRVGYLGQEQFRSAINNAFDLQLSNEQFLALLDHVPLTKQGYVRYPEFMAQFDTRYAQMKY